MSSDDLFHKCYIHLRAKQDLKVQSHCLQLLYAKLLHRWWPPLERYFVIGSVRLAIVVPICVSLLVGFYKHVCHLGVTPTKLGNTCCLLCGEIASLVKRVVLFWISCPDSSSYMCKREMLLWWKTLLFPSASWDPQEISYIYYSQAYFLHRQNVRGYGWIPKKS